jgi:hypothetical protein
MAVSFYVEGNKLPGQDVARIQFSKSSSPSRMERTPVMSVKARDRGSLKLRDKYSNREEPLPNLIEARDAGSSSR